MTRQLRLTRSLVERGFAAFPPGTHRPVDSSRRTAGDADYHEMARAIMADAPADGFWLFAYGSLIWNPAFEFVESRVATALGWRRTFSLGYDRFFRGCVERPGLMMVLDRGGSCTGLAYRFAPGATAGNLDRLLRREVPLLPSAQPPRWIRIRTGEGQVRALAFAVDRNGPAYVGGHSHQEIARLLAVASGPNGSMAEYLLNTVEHLEQLGIHDRMLWALQDLVARRIEELTSA